MSLPGYEDIEGLTAEVYAKRDLFVAHLQEHANADKPITVGQLAKTFSVRWSQIPALRKACWIDGIPIASCSKGYYYALTSAQFQPTCDHIRARAQAEQLNDALCTTIMSSLLHDDKRRKVFEAEASLF